MDRFQKFFLCVVFFLSSALTASSVFAYSSTLTQNTSRTGQSYTFTFSNLPPSTSNISVRVQLYGDYNSSSEYADVTIDGRAQSRIIGNDGQCNTTVSRNQRTYSLPASNVADKKLIVLVRNSSSVNHPLCSNRPRVVVTLTYSEAKNADLVVDLLSVTPTTTAPGAKVQVSYRVYNQGFANASSFVLRLYYSTDTTITTSDSYLHHERTLSLNTKQRSQTYTVTVDLPSTASPGTAYVGAFVDYNNRIKEQSDTNNTRAFRLTLVANKPDLVFSSSTVPLSGNNVTQGGILQGKYTIRNAGKAFTTDFDVYFYYCSTSSTSSCSTRIGTLKVTKDFGIGTTHSFDSPKLTLPANAALGTRYIRAFVDSTSKVAEFNESNNNDMDPITVVAPQPDLRIDSLALSAKDSYAGDKVVVTFKVLNAGSADAAAAIVRLYYSTDASITTADTYLNVQQQVTLKKGTTSTEYKLTVTMPSNATLGTRYLGAIVDYNNRVRESNEANNTRAVAVSIKEVVELKADKFSLTQTTQPIGGLMNVQFEVSNSSKYTVQSYEVGFYYSKTATVTNKSTLLKKITRTLLSAGVSEFGSESIKLPTSIAGGEGYVAIIFDPDNKIKEISETNNKITVKTNFLKDADNDGFSPKPDCKPGQCDCDDNNKAINPKARELCDGKDNNCDGKIDENFADKGKACTSGKGICQATGKQVCKSDGSALECDAKEGQPVAEICNGKDDDCDGQVDENFTDLGKACEDGKGECKETGKQVCTKDGKGVECSAKAFAPKKEICDGKDNDCDGQTDEDFADLGKACEAGKGECKAQGKQACKADGSGLECDATPGQPQQEICDQKDNNCDGQVDENNVCDPCKNVTCQSDEFCRAGTCVKACGCTKCAADEKCVDGRCQADPCAQVTCQTDEVCDNGKCVTDPCKGVTCQQDEVCKAGKCEPSPCKGVQCPGDMECKDGQCVGKQCPDEPEPNPEPKAEPGVEPVADGSEPSAEPVTDSGKEVVPEVVEDSAPDTVVQDNGTTQDKTSGTDKGSKDGGSGDKAPEGGCNCETAQRTGTPWFWALLVLMVGFRRRRRG